MVFKRFFKKKQAGSDPVHGATLAHMTVGAIVDYDLKSWEVSAYNVYDFGDGDQAREWQLKSSEETVYLELESDDEDAWSLNRKIPFDNIAGGIKEHIQTHEDPPDKIEFEGTAYYLEETAGGHFHKGGEGVGREFLRWSYTDDSGKKYIGIEQWGEDDFEASAGVKVEAYQFTNILIS